MKQYTRKQAITYALERKLFWSLSSSIIVFVALYGFFVSMSIINVVVREEIEQRIVKVNASISELEFAYIERKNTITETFALSQGFVIPEGESFVARRSTVSTRLTLRDEL